MVSILLVGVGDSIDENCQTLSFHRCSIRQKFQIRTPSAQPTEKPVPPHGEREFLPLVIRNSGTAQQ